MLEEYLIHNNVKHNDFYIYGFYDFKHRDIYKYFLDIKI